MSEFDDQRPLEDWEYPDSDQDGDDFVDTIICPECGHQVYEEAPSCPSCGYFITAADRTGAGVARIGWVGVLIVLALVAMLLAGFLG
jgi:ribosomal protein L37E